ncbi:hypothetical protein [Streptomyces sp. NBC_01198]|uniref:hypothetical protein n=1 Tax=Streptomyces sp. NBC_01198 TaxID=2903769 RepID=UPI002E0F0421|nr:hypothetical protein OG702_28955 [Streptomyces sp. NBC_01198]
MDTASTAAISALTSGAVSLGLVVAANRQQRRDGSRAQRETQNMTYLNPLRWHTAETHHRLSLYAVRVDRQGFYGPAQVIRAPEEIDGKDATWFAGTGCALVSSVWITACLFAQMTRARSDLPFLRLSGRDDTRLSTSIMKVHVAFAACGVFYATQSSIGTDALLEPEGRLRSYREFCSILADPERRAWADPLVRFHLAIANGDRREELRRVLEALRTLSDFLDNTLAGGASLRARWDAEL